MLIKGNLDDMEQEGSRSVGRPSTHPSASVSDPTSRDEAKLLHSPSTPARRFHLCLPVKSSC